MKKALRGPRKAFFFASGGPFGRTKGAGPLWNP
jgi:hypothetical protein